VVGGKELNSVCPALHIHETANTQRNSISCFDCRLLRESCLVSCLLLCTAAITSSHVHEGLVHESVEPVCFTYWRMPDALGLLGSCYSPHL
jgi:hypothetical protein